MASLLDLNSYSLQGFVFNDTRPFGITILSNPVTTANINVQEDSSHYTNPLSVISSLNSAIGANVSYTIYPISVGHGTGNQTLTSLPKVTWPTLPAGLTQTSNAAGYYTVGNITSVSQWNTIKSPLITAPDDVTTSWSYGAKISYLQNGSLVHKDWTINATVTNDIAEFYIDPSLTNYFVPNVSSHIFGPTITNSNATGTYTMTITGNNTSIIGNITTTGTSGSQSWNASTKTLTLTGNLSQVNTRLSNVYLATNTTSQSPTTLIYTLTNPSGLVTTINQPLGVSPATSNIGYNRYYTQNTIGTLFPTNPLQVFEDTPSSTVYTFSITLGSNIGTIGTSNNVRDDAGWNSANLTYTFTDTKANVNSKLTSIVFAPWRSTQSTTTITYKQYKGSTPQVNASMNFIGNARTASFTTGTYVFTDPTSVASQISLEQFYYQPCDILIVGRGGDSAMPTPGSSQSNYDAYSGGGGAGGLKFLANSTMFSGMSIAGDNKPTITVGHNYYDQGRGEGSSISLNGTSVLSVLGGGNCGSIGGHMNLDGTGQQYNGYYGGSGGGGSIGFQQNGIGSYQPVNGSGGLGASGQGNSGGQSQLLGGSPWCTGGGGGGAGGAGGSNGASGNGFSSSITGTAVTYAIGGSGSPSFSAPTTPGSGGSSTNDHWHGQPGIVVIRFY